jgi:hypothetical protein
VFALPGPEEVQESAVKCKEGATCYMAHANPVMVEAVPKKMADEKFKEVYK